MSLSRPGILCKVVNLDVCTLENEQQLERTTPGAASTSASTNFHLFEQIKYLVLVRESKSRIRTVGVRKKMA